MGILLNKKEKDFLEKVGFIKEENYYWNKFPINNLYDLYVEVNLNKKEVELMVEYECGGEITSEIELIPDSFDDYLNDYDTDFETSLITWLDEIITDMVDRWKEM